MYPEPLALCSSLRQPHEDGFFSLLVRHLAGKAPPFETWIKDSGSAVECWVADAWDRNTLVCRGLK
jgi:hypothetical protein